ncbi:MAG: ABC transporter permease [Agathobacter sp.]|nr:ABC transporter permease [Agathobacter sp.]
MVNIIITTWKRLLRDKANTFWILCFPIILGTLFNVAFSNMAASEDMSAINVAVICEDDLYGEALKQSIETISEGKDAMLNAIFCDDKKATELLEKKDVVGIIHSGKTAKLSISANMSTESINQSILQAFINEYNMYQDSIAKIMINHPENIENVLSNFESISDFNNEVTISRKPDADPFSQYFYNLLAMACLYTSMGGVLVATHNQANLSDLGMRKCLSPTHKLKSIVSELIATSTYEFALNFIGFIYVAYVLKVDIASRLPLAILTTFVGCLTGVSLGFFIGSFGQKSQDFKQGMIFAVTMPLCFLSGLMMGNMKIIIQNNCPILNKINPATIITDSFYSLAIYESYDRFIFDIISLLIFVIIFIMAGFLMTRRKKYASL